MEKTLKKFITLGLMITCSVLAISCGKNPKAQLKVSKNQIKQGESISIEWNTKNAKTVLLNGKPITKVGSMVEIPSDTISYELVGKKGKKEARDKQIVVVEVLPANPTNASNNNSTVVSHPIDKEKIFINSPITDFPGKIKSIFFDFDRFDLRDDAKLTLNSNAKLLTQDETNTIIFRLEGDCDSRGSEEYNLALGDKRANTAKNYLIGKGIDPSRINVISNGERYATGSFEGSCEITPSWAHDRRAEFVYVQGGKKTTKPEAFANNK